MGEREEMLGEVGLVVNYGWVKVVVEVEEKYEEESACVLFFLILFSACKGEIPMSLACAAPCFRAWMFPTPFDSIYFTPGY